jgi:hypothetical protein
MAITPKNKRPKGIILLVNGQAKETLESTKEMRALCNAGYLVISPKLSDDGVGGLLELHNSIKEIYAAIRAMEPLPLILFAFQNGGRLALLTPELKVFDFSEAVFGGVLTEWPIKQLSPDRHAIPKLRHISIYFFPESSDWSHENADKLKNIFHESEVSLVEIPLRSRKTRTMDIISEWLLPPRKEQTFNVL